MTDPTREKRAELRGLAEGYVAAVKAAMLPANEYPDAAAISYACRRRADAAEEFRLCATPATVLSLLDALDAKDAELASVRARSEAERRVVEASLSTYSAAERGLPEMAQDIFRRERRDAVRALLALRKDQTDGD